MLLAPLCRGKMPLPSRGWGGKDIACQESAIGRECPTSAKPWRGLTRSKATSVITSTSPIPDSCIVGCSWSLGGDRGLDEHGGHMSMSDPSPAPILYRVSCIEHESCQLVQNLMLVGM
jgi:hypothetical protein